MWPDGRLSVGCFPCGECLIPKPSGVRIRRNHMKRPEPTGLAPWRSQCRAYRRSFLPCPVKNSSLTYKTLCGRGGSGLVFLGASEPPPGLVPEGFTGTWVGFEAAQGKPSRSGDAFAVGSSCRLIAGPPRPALVFLTRPPGSPPRSRGG